MLWGLDTGTQSYFAPGPTGISNQSWWTSFLGSIGPITQMEQFSSSIGHLSSGVLGVYVACILLSASLSSLCSGYVADLLSRKYGILTGGIVVLLGTIISASAKTFPVLVCARLITGIGQGQSISVVTIYLCEISPQEIRGTVATMLQLLITIGIALGYFVAYASSRIGGELAWRAPFILEASMAAILVSGMAFMPYSPRWLVQRGRIDEARAVLQKLRASSEFVEDELRLIKGSLEEQSREDASYREIFQKRYIRRSALSVFLMSFQMLCGVCVVLYSQRLISVDAYFSRSMRSFITLRSCSLKLVLRQIGQLSLHLAFLE
jgi:MFS family permease